LYGRKRKPLGKYPQSKYGAENASREGEKSTSLFYRRKIVASVERYLLESLCAKLEENATDHAVAKAGKSLGTTIPPMRHGAVTKLVASLQSMYPFLTVSKMNNTLVACRKLRATGKQPNEENNPPTHQHITRLCHRQASHFYIRASTGVNKKE
jgi:hypothetical protein